MSAPSNAVVYVIDDHAAVRESVEWLVGSVGLSARTFPSAAAFLEACPADPPGCIVLDICMDGMNGIELQRHLKGRGDTTPIIMVTGFATVPQAVESLQNGACDFLQKPYRDEDLITRIRAALKRDEEQRSLRAARDDARARIEQLTPRETEVMQYVVQGMSSRQIATKLGLSIKTVEAHRGNYSVKLGIKSVAELVLLNVAAADDAAPRSGPGGSAA